MTARRQWRWEVNLIGSKQINAFCMPGGKIAVFTGILDQLELTDDETAMVLGHEIAHALREHARARIAKSQGTGAFLSLGAALLGLGQLGDVAASIGTQLLTLKFSREDEIDADLVGLELAARAGFNPEASIRLWEKMGQAKEVAMAEPPSCPLTRRGPTASSACRKTCRRCAGFISRPWHGVRGTVIPGLTRNPGLWRAHMDPGSSPG